jgi:hypothetical protein
VGDNRQGAMSAKDAGFCGVGAVGGLPTLAAFHVCDTCLRTLVERFR